MFNLNTEDINSVGKTIGTLLFFIVIIIGILIIIDEIFHISKFCYKYTYLYNYGKLNENICTKDNNNLIEFERARYRVHNEINKYKLEKDLFNKNWINYVVFICVLLMSVLMCFAFGYLFYHLFIDNNNDCKIDNNNLSFINLLLKCTGQETRVPNCSFNYFILFILIIIYPLIFILKYLVNLDYSLESKGIYTKFFHLSIFLYLLYLVYILLYLKDDSDYWNLTKISLYISFVIVFYIVNIIYNKVYSEYYNINKGTNIYSQDKTLIGILNKYFHFADNDKATFNKDDFRDINFFEIYKQQEPLKPKNINKPIELAEFEYCKESDFNDPKKKYCSNFKYLSSDPKYLEEKKILDDNVIVAEKAVKDDPESAAAYGLSDAKKAVALFKTREDYNDTQKIIEKYYKENEQYEKDLNSYNLKYNIYKNNKIEFPEFVSVISYMIPKLLGSDKITHILLFICLLVFLFYYNYLKTNNKRKEANYIYSTIIIYILCLLSILVLSNSVLTYNTYLNKYLIYEPISYYKEDLFNIDLLFNILLNKYNKNISNNYISLYNILNSKKLNNYTNSGSEIKTLENIIEDIKTKDEILNTDINNPDDADLKTFRAQILRVLFSDLLKNNDIKLASDDDIINLKDNLLEAKINSFIGKDPKLITYTNAEYNKNLKTFFIIIKNIFVEDKRNFDNHIQQLKNNLKSIIYGKIDDIKIFNNDIKFYNDYLIKDVSNNDLIKLETIKEDKYTKLYLHNLSYINMIFDYYKTFLKEFRNIIIDFFNSVDIICEDKENVININNKLNNLFKKLFRNDKEFTNGNYLTSFNFKDISKLKEINLYKKMINLKVEELNNKYFKYFNIVKAILRKGFNISEDNSDTNKLEYNIINNYNFFNKDTTKHISPHLKQYPISINSNTKNKYELYDSDKLLKLNLSINNVSWSFVILMIIILIFLIEPIIIQS